MKARQIVKALKDESDFFSDADSDKYILHSRYKLSEMIARDRSENIKIERHILATLLYIEIGSLKKVGDYIGRDHATVLNSLKFVHSDYFYDHRIKARINKHSEELEHYRKNSLQPTVPNALLSMENYLFTTARI
jgi:hypothetical protein